MSQTTEHTFVAHVEDDVGKESLRHVLEIVEHGECFEVADERS